MPQLIPMFNQIKNKRLYQGVIEQIQSMVMTGRLRNGDRLPNERELALQLGVSRASVREALRVLEIVGLVQSRQGDGTFIRNQLEDARFEPLSIIFSLHNGKLADILEVRIMLETRAAALAATGIKACDVKLLKKIGVRMERETLETQAADLDRELHFAIARISGNPLLVTFFNSISMLMENAIRESRARLFANDRDRKLLCRQHRGIINAITGRDESAAARAMTRHLIHVRKRLGE